jgi:hypothetical protein
MLMIRFVSALSSFLTSTALVAMVIGIAAVGRTALADPPISPNNTIPGCELGNCSAQFDCTDEIPFGCGDGFCNGPDDTACSCVCRVSNDGCACVTRPN